MQVQVCGESVNFIDQKAYVEQNIIIVLFKTFNGGYFPVQHTETTKNIAKPLDVET